MDKLTKTPSLCIEFLEEREMEELEIWLVATTVFFSTILFATPKRHCFSSSEENLMQ